MGRNTHADDGAQIETTLAFISEHYADYEPFERVAEAIVRSGDRRVEYVYEISHEGESPTLQVSAEYYVDGELVNESNTTQKYETDGERVYHTESGQELEAFIKANAFADPEVTIGEEFESMVDEPA
jgi:hypothetical protein